MSDLSRIMNFGRRLKSGEHAFVAGDKAQQQYHVRSGMLKSYFINGQGDEYVTGFYLPGEVVPNYIKEGRHAHSVVALEEASVCVVHNTPAHQRDNARVWQAISARSHGMTSQGLTHQINMKVTSAEGRFAGFCVDLMQRLRQLHRDPCHLPTPMTRTDIASYLGLTLESLSRVISKMKKNGVISADRQHINVLTPETLKTLALHLN